MNPITSWIQSMMEDTNIREDAYVTRVSRMKENCDRVKDTWQMPNRAEGHWRQAALAQTNPSFKGGFIATSIRQGHTSSTANNCDSSIAFFEKQGEKN
mmetsp:Transcript_63020/g.86627  ORF Transcript_63020/g.86627 Transcript_63020/m.86627 type:complete len:98 (+) Transcript_63020:20-313(+)